MIGINMVCMIYILMHTKNMDRGVWVVIQYVGVILGHLAT